MVYDTYTTFGFENIVVKLSTRPEQRVGSDEMWDRAEADLKQALEALEIAYEIQEGEVRSTDLRLNLLCMIVWTAHGNVVQCSSILHYQNV